MCIEEPIVQERSGPAVLRFEARWLKEKFFMEIVQGAWDADGPKKINNSLAGKLARVHDHLHKWDKSVLKRTKNNLRKTHREMEVVVRKSLTPKNIARQKELSEEIELLLDMEEHHWAQRNRVNWLQQGDKNTAYFHNFTTARRQRNHVKRLIDEEGNCIEGSAYLNPHVSNYFGGLFTTEIEEPNPELINKVIPKVIERMNEDLIKPYIAADIKKTLFSIGDIKAPGRMGSMQYSSKNVGELLANL
jgi:hypothetical protein